MSTTFDVYPRKREIPSLGALLHRSTAELHTCLASVGVEARPEICCRLRRRADHANVPISRRDEARWSAGAYAWFSVGGVPGGTDAYFEASAEAIRECWEEELANAKYAPFEPLMREAMAVGHAWSFRRSVGQPAIINIAYGLIAASLASLTDGFLHSIDSAWDWDRLPALPEEFLTWYFRPEQALDVQNREWAERCIAALHEELGGRRR